MDTSLSAKMRTQYLQDMSAKAGCAGDWRRYHGCGNCLGRQRRGMSVGLVEMNDFASGTSSRSTKLIHGGLRYLKQGRSAWYARWVLNGHCFTGALRIWWSLFRCSQFIRKALMVILPARSDCICTTGWQGSNANERRKTLTLEPLFRKEGLKGSGYYYEYRTDDARLTVEVMKSARAKGRSSRIMPKSRNSCIEEEK